MLRDYQLEIVRCIIESFKRNRSIMLQMPTGTGKTHVLADVVRSVACSDSRDEACAPVWIVAHRRELVAQIEDTLGRYGITGTGSCVRVMAIQWLTRHWNDVGERPSLVIIDEAHHASAATYRVLWDRCPDARFLGLTATPCRMDKTGFTDLFDTLVMSWSVAEFIRKGFLSVFDYVTIRPDTEEQRLVDSLTKRGADGDYQVKEMERVLNRHTSIRRLYSSVERFASGRKGIVYAVSIDHARSIAAYYGSRGLNAVAIDSKTPAAERRKMVDDFVAGRVRVLVNVDIFSEGFDCPDVEFVQMARPTLSLAKYLQQVGRGLRKTSGKKTCVMIDNVGLYRVFGLPTVVWDWQAMFRGFRSGKGLPVVGSTPAERTPHVRPAENDVCGQAMEMVVSHRQLEAEINASDDSSRRSTPATWELKAWQDAKSGLWGLKRGEESTADAVFAAVFDTGYDMAAVRLGNDICALVTAEGKVIMENGRCRSMRFVQDHLLSVVSVDGSRCYVDLHSLHTYTVKPIIKRFGNIELLKAGSAHYSRTRKLYVNGQDSDSFFVAYRRFYVSVFDYKTPLSRLYDTDAQLFYRCGYACVLENDYRCCYWLHCRLSDGSIIVYDDEGRYYHAMQGATRCIGCCDTAEECVRCRETVERMERQDALARQAYEAEKTEKIRQMLMDKDDAHPFRRGVKWGLRVGDRVTVPPIYRNIKPPVGRYCAVEMNYSQWGVVAIDGTLMIEPRYQGVEISVQGIVTVTKITGSKMSVKLP